MEPESLTEAAHEVTADLHSTAHELYYQDPKFWVAVGFIVFVALAIKYIWPAIGRGLDSRAATIRNQLEQAARLQAEAEQLLADYKAQQAQALKDAELIVEHAQRDAAIIREQAAKELQTTLERRAAQAEENIRRAEQQAVSQMRAHLIDVATEASRTVVSEQLAGQKDDPAIARALAAIERQIH